MPLVDSVALAAVTGLPVCTGPEYDEVCEIEYGKGRWKGKKRTCERIGE